MQSRFIFLVSGKARHGKDTAAGILNEEFSFQRVAFADTLKMEAVKLGWDGKKDEKGRRLLQELGRQRREEDIDYWVKRAIDTIANRRFLPVCEEDRQEVILHGRIPVTAGEVPGIVIPDCRFPSEIESVRKWGRDNGYEVVTVRVERPDFDNGLSESARQDPSETALDGYMFDYRIENRDLSFFRESLLAVAEKAGVTRIPRVVRAKDFKADDIDNGKPVITIDFDDTLLEKTGTIDVIPFFRLLSSMEGVSLLIVTARKDDPEPVVRFCKEQGVDVKAVVYDAKNKDILKSIRPVIHFDDDVNVSASLARAGIPCFLAGAFSDRDYTLDWEEKLTASGEIDHYPPGARKKMLVTEENERGFNVDWDLYDR